MNTFGEIIEQIKIAPVIIIHRHTNPDPDALGAQFGLATSIKSTYPEKTVLLAGESVGDLDWMTTMNQVTDEQYAQALVIVVDTANTPRISDQRYSLGTTVIKIDHHPNVDPYGDLNYVDTSASSCSEIIVDLINHAGNDLTLTKPIAAALYTGIVGDTGRFMYSNATVHTFNVVAQLLSFGFQPDKINQRMGQITLNQAKLQGYVLEHLIVAENGAAKAIIPADVLEKLGLQQADAHVAVTTPGRLKEVTCWVLAVAKPDGTYRIHLRSQGPVINDIASEHDGGGHPLASGANAQNEAEVEQIFAQLQAKLT
ncbi:DHH family phosphoesterase [Bombilactobacillus thymidiniphilus]|uniref:Bifunctional oligoribonuclease/PAP phosphatase NrnA n=1 Tax=Bombilactobacillus thymidiniphilus TaxID=2923363 RepID=A0ABY4PEZ7_9LACO|nr:bifunctional oligoribonuclease/PAP phosphatase NrnA [Bombilactobacillus thymidiniphilus]UQS84326.1 bifunctional oligoribonuclease/PAP phosphatase NrnA [Bombilactobacillus thymidiniphilus]